MRLPKRILPIVERLRAEVPRPPAEPGLCLSGVGLPRWPLFEGYTCPLGLLPDSIYRCPFSGDDFRPGTAPPLEEILDFARWWDSLTLDKACKAVEEIWK